VRAVAEYAETVERRHAEGAGEVAITPAAGDALALHGIADLVGECDRMIVELLDSGRLHERRPIQARRDLELHVRIIALECQQLCADLGLMLRQRHQAVDDRLAGEGHHVLVRATLDDADIERDVAVVVGHGFDREDLARHLADRAAPLGMIRARVRGNAGGLEVIARDAVARDRDAAEVA